MAERANETRVGPEHWSQAIADTDGHQIVVAGPGTGKTEFLVRRVGHLIAELDVPRDQVVVLCFSRRASADIGRRIESRIGATGIPIDTTTFHSLALRLIEAVSDGERPTPLTTPEQVGVVAGILGTERSKGLARPLSRNSHDSCVRCRGRRLLDAMLRKTSHTRRP